MEVGRICVKLVGRETGRKCVVVDVVDKNFVLITGPKSVTGVRRRRTNVDHLEPTPESVEVKKGAPDDEVEKALTKDKKTKFMKEDLLPTAAS
jgi:large subunit ribosomal protein L14e